MLREAHEGGCAEQTGARSLAQKIMRAGFFWPTMKKDAEEIVRKCDSCQKHVWRIHVPATEMIDVSSPCPSARQGIDIVGCFLKARESK